MKHPKRRLLALIVLAFLSAHDIDRALACFCAPLPLVDQFDYSTSVFAGQVIQVDDSMVIGQSLADPVEVTFEVHTVWKGPSSRRLRVTTARSEASCGKNFQSGREYLVFAHASETALQTGLCTRTQLMANADEDLVALGNGNAPEFEDINDATNARRVLFAAMFGLIAIGIIAASVVFRQSRLYREDETD